LFPSWAARFFVALCIVAACPAARRCSGRAPLPLSMYWWGWQGHAFRGRSHASHVVFKVFRGLAWRAFVVLAVLIFTLGLQLNSGA